MDPLFLWGLHRSLHAPSTGIPQPQHRCWSRLAIPGAGRSTSSHDVRCCAACAGAWAHAATALRNGSPEDEGEPDEATPAHALPGSSQGAAAPAPPPGLPLPGFAGAPAQPAFAAAAPGALAALQPPQRMPMPQPSPVSGQQEQRALIQQMSAPASGQPPLPMGQPATAAQAAAAPLALPILMPLHAAVGQPGMPVNNGEP
jgi:hypothetical protein